MTKVSFTLHAIERFKERFQQMILPSESTFIALERVYHASREDKRIKNDTAHMVFLMDKYGDFNFRFRVNGDVVFVCRSELVITIIDKSQSHHRAKQTYRKNNSGFQRRA